MDSDERIVALKKAYADIILNTSKEAASRVAASERKSQQLEYQLRETKEETTRMMLRLKKMMDDKIKEAEVPLRNKQEKINELEAQLQEAEDIVSDLREALRYAEDKFERAITNDAQCLEKHDNATLEGGSVENRQRNSQYITFPHLESQKDSLAVSEKENSYLNQRAESTNCYSEQIQTRNLYGARPELPSIISRSKKLEFCRKGCTQRINAFERSIFNGESSVSRRPNDVSSEGKAEGEKQERPNDVSSEGKAEGEKQDKGTCKTNSEGGSMTFDIGSREIVNEDGSISCCYELHPRNVITLKSKTDSKERNSRSTAAKKMPKKMFEKINQAPELSSSNPSPRSNENNWQSDDNPTLMALKLSTRTDKVAQRLRAINTATNGDNIKEGDVEKTTAKGKASVISVPIVQDGASIESSIVQVSKTNLKKVAEPIIHTKFKTTKATDESPSLPGDHRVIKYTFQRKRKRNTLSICDGNVSVENHIAQREEEEEKTQSAEPEKSSSFEETAHLLVALSQGKYGR